jgi:hypothetical protein
MCYCGTEIALIDVVLAMWWRVKCGDIDGNVVLKVKSV